MTFLPSKARQLKELASEQKHVLYAPEAFETLSQCNYLPFRRPSALSSDSSFCFRQGFALMHYSPIGSVGPGRRVKQREKRHAVNGWKCGGAMYKLLRGPNKRIRGFQGTVTLLLSRDHLQDGIVLFRRAEEISEIVPAT
eukprot:GFKZ01001047.1.p2 GENE.GFKZ01001047.1~~GFKZ01001047.1.p2  ORF type:complete len:140 (-),score=8.45 GFKZ01001047.1:1741-2160(-)